MSEELKCGFIDVVGCTASVEYQNRNIGCLSPESISTFNTEFFKNQNMIYTKSNVQNFDSKRI
jgi:hypothetical protein